MSAVTPAFLDSSHIAAGRPKHHARRWPDRRLVSVAGVLGLIAGIFGGVPFGTVRPVMTANSAKRP
jgi:hypothetical protein